MPADAGAFELLGLLLGEQVEVREGRFEGGRAEFAQARARTGGSDAVER